MKENRYSKKSSLLRYACFIWISVLTVTNWILLGLPGASVLLKVSYVNEFQELLNQFFSGKYIF